MKIVITPVGTSLISNYTNDDKDIYNLVKSILTEEKFSILSSDERSQIQDYLGAFLKNSLHSCAERTSLDAIKEELAHKISIIFLLSDTHIADFLGEIFTSYFSNSQLKKIDGLQTDSKEDFENKGLSNFMTFFDAQEKRNLIFNITTGYKAFTQYLTIVGQIYHIPVKYIFERSNELMTIPELPIGFDDQVADLYFPYLNDLILNQVTITPQIETELLKYGLVKRGEKDLVLTVFGKLFKNAINHRASSFGDLIEHLLLSIYIQDQTLNVKKSCPYTLKDGKTGDIDLLLTSNDGKKIELIEVKSFGQFEKFDKNQLPKYIQYANEKYSDKSKTITILFYLLESTLLDRHKEKFNEISQKCQNEKIEFKVNYIEIQPENFPNFLRKFEQKKIASFSF